MNSQDEPRHALRRAEEDAEAVESWSRTPQTDSAAYRLAFTDREFLKREDLRPVRLQLELLKAGVTMDEAGIDSTVVVFGGARIPRPEAKDTAKTRYLGELSHFYEEARAFARRCTEESLKGGGRDWVVVTGGGPGVMEAGNRGAAEAGGRSIGLGIVLPFESRPNDWVTPELSFNFHYFAIRKMHFLMRAAAVAAFPGGYGTLDELFETLTLISTGRMAPIPVLLFGEEFWRRIVNWEALADAGTISPEDLKLFRFVETADQAWAEIANWERPVVARMTSGAKDGR